MIKNVLPLLFSIVLLSACETENDTEAVNAPPMSHIEMFECHQNETWEAAQIENHLVGDWKWEFISCYLDPTNGNGTQYQGLKLRFTENHTLQLWQDGSLQEEATWELYHTNPHYGIKTSESIAQVIGNIVICGENLEFSASAIDVCDNYFTRIP